MKENKLKDSSNLVLELTDYDIEREFARADARLKNAGQKYVRDYYDEEDPLRPKIDVILFVQDRKPWSLCIPYEMNGKIHPFYPDFIIIRQDSTGGYLLEQAPLRSPQHDSFIKHTAERIIG